MLILIPLHRNCCAIYYGCPHKLRWQNVLFQPAGFCNSLGWGWWYSGREKSWLYRPLLSSLLLLISSVKHRMFQQGLEKWSFQMLPPFIVVEKRCKPFVVSWNIWAQNLELVVLVCLDVLWDISALLGRNQLEGSGYSAVWSFVHFSSLYLEIYIGPTSCYLSSPSVKSSAFDLWWNCWQS